MSGNQSFLKNARFSQALQGLGSRVSGQVQAAPVKWAPSLLALHWASLLNAHSLCVLSVPPLRFVLDLPRFRLGDSFSPLNGLTLHGWARRLA